MLRNDVSARLNDPSDSVFILEMSDCKIVSLVAMVVKRDFDCDLRHFESLRRQYDDPREVTLLMSKLLNKIVVISTLPKDKF